MPVDGRGQTHHGALRAVRVHRVPHRHVAVIIDVLQHHAVLAHRLLLHRVVGPEAAVLAVRHPHAQKCQREGVRARVERLELRLQLLVEQDRRRPPARRLEHARVDVSLSAHVCCIATEVEDAHQDA